MSKTYPWLFCLLFVIGSLTGLRGDVTCTEVPPITGSFAAVQEGHGAEGPLTVASLNLGRVTSAARIVEHFKQVPSLLEADVLFFQEVEEFPEEGSTVTADLAELLERYHIFAPAYEIEGSGFHGLSIVSRYPLTDIEIIRLKKFRLKVNTRCRIALAVSVDSPAGKVRMINVHLDTRINARRRLEQIQPVLEAARSSDGAVVLGGDLNTQNFYWVGNVIPIPFFHRQIRPVKEALEALGFSTPFGSSQTHKWAPLKLDWIYMKGLSLVDHGIEDAGFSDHRAIWVRLK